MICPSEIAALVNAISIAVSKGKSVEELNILAAIFIQIGDTLTTISTQTANIQQCCDNLKNNNSPPNASEFIT